MECCAKNKKNSWDIFCKPSTSTFNIRVDYGKKKGGGKNRHLKLVMRKGTMGILVVWEEGASCWSGKEYQGRKRYWLNKCGDIYMEIVVLAWVIALDLMKWLNFTLNLLFILLSFVLNSSTMIQKFLPNPKYLKIKYAI